jgi:hypothetical protein
MALGKTWAQSSALVATVDKPTHTSQGKPNDKVQYILFIEIKIFPSFVQPQLEP